MDDFDIYGDLEKYESEAKKDSEEVQDLLRRITELEKQLESKEQEKCDIEKKNRILAENISSLLLTAKAELKRKDTIIADLRKQCDNAAFRRGNQGPKVVASGKKREQATQTSVCHSRHTAVQTDLSKQEECSDRKRKAVRELNGDDETRESKRVRVHERGSSNRDLENDRERRREKSREREKDRYRDRDTDRLRCRDRARSRERVRERSRDRHKPRTSDRDREGMARRERDPIKESEANRKSELTDRKDRNLGGRGARSRPGNSSRDQQAKESVSSDHKSVPYNVERKSVSKDVGQSHRTERRTHSTKSNHAVDIRDSNDIVKAQTATSDKIPEESDPVVTILNSPGTVEQQNTIQKNTDETFPDTRNFGKFRNDSSPVAASTKCTTLDASEADPQHKPSINEHLITQNNDTNAETCSIVSQSVTKDSIQQIPATHFRPNSVTIEPAIAEVAQQETCVEDTTNDQTTDYTQVPSREVTMVCASEDPNNSIDLPETMPTKASGDANVSLKSPNQTVRPLSQEEGNGEQILESTSHTSNEKSTSKGDVTEHDSTARSVADTIMVNKSPEARIESGAEKDHAMEGKQNDSNSYTVVEAEAAVDQIISYDQQQDAMAGLTESDLVLAENKHSAKLQLPKFKEPTCNFIEWNDDILSSSKHLTKPVHPRIRALVKEAVAFKKALNNHKLATKLTEPIDLAEALVTHRRLPSNHGMCSTVQNYPSREAVIAARPEPLDGKLNNTTDNQLPPNDSHQVSGAGSNVNRQYEASSHCSSNFGNEFLKITSTCTISSSSSSSSSMNRLPAGGRTGSVLSLQQIRGPSSTAVNVTVNELPSSEPQANASLPMMASSGPNYAVYTPWRNYFKDTNVENETIASNIKSPTKTTTSVEDQPVTTLNASNPTKNDETNDIGSVTTARASSAPMVDCSLKGDQLTECSTSRTSSVVGHELLISKACSTTNDVTSDANSGTGNLAESCKQPTTALAGTINSKRRMSVGCLTEDKRPRTDLSSTTSRSASLSKEFFSPIALPIVSALDFVQPKPRCSTGAKTVCSTPKSKAPALPQTPPTPMVVLHSPAKSCRTPLKGPPMMESEFDANSSVQNIMDSLLKTPIKTEINDELEHDGNVPGIDESMFSNVSAISHDVLYKSYFCSENPLSAVKSDPEEEKTPVKQPGEAAMVDLVSPWHTAMSSTPVTATKSIPRIENTAEANVSAVTTDISSSNIFLSNSEHISLSNSMLEVCVDRDILPSESSQNVTNISSAASKRAPEAVVRQRRRSSKKRKKKEKNSITDGHSRRSKRKKQQSNDTSSTTLEQTSASTTTLGPLPSGDVPREQFVPQPAQREYATGEIIPDKCDTIGNDTMLLQTIKATSEQQSTEMVNCRADVPNVVQGTTGKPPNRVNFTTESANATKSIASGAGNSSAPAVDPTVEAATASGTTDKENVPWVKKESILRTPGQFVTPDGPVNFVREMRVVKESPNYMRVYITRKKV